MHGIHFHKGRQSQLLEIGIGSALKNTAVRDLCFVNLSWFEFHFTLQVNVSCGQDTHVEIGVNAAHRKLQLGMVCNDLVRRLPLLDQRTDDPVFLVKFTSGHADARTGLLKAFPIFAVSKSGIVSVFVRDGTVGNLFITAVADIGSFIESAAAFPFKVRTGLVAGRAGSALDTAKKDFPTGICLFAMIAVYTKVSGIIKGTFVIPVGQPVCFHFLRNRSGILTEEACDIFKRSTFGKFILDVDTIIQSQVFLITRYILTHSLIPPTAVRRKDKPITFI